MEEFLYGLFIHFWFLVFHIMVFNNCNYSVLTRRRVRHNVLCVHALALNHMQQFHYINLLSPFCIEPRLRVTRGSVCMYSALKHKARSNPKETVSRSIVHCLQPYARNTETLLRSHKETKTVLEKTSGTRHGHG